MSNTLIRLIDERLRRERLSLRDAAQQMEYVSHSTLFRVLKGDRYDVQTMIAICQWLGVLPSTVLDDMAGVGGAGPLQIILDQHPELAETFSRMVESPEIIRMVLIFADFVMEHRNEYGV